MTNWILTFSILATLLFAALPEDKVLGQEFRIESQVFVGDTTQPAAENLTLYRGEMVYDFRLANDASHEPIEIVIYDSRKRQFTLLDLSREIRTDIADFELLKMLQGLKETAETNEDAIPLVEPKFERDFEVSNKTITLTNDDITYQAIGESPEDLSAMPLFYEAMDQLTKLSVSDPSRLPPFARMALNQEIKKHGMFPIEIRVHMREGVVTRQAFDAKSKHTALWKLSNRDTQRIDDAKRKWMKYRSVPLGEYRQIEAVTSNRGR